jgi:hypothetical protein
MLLLSELPSLDEVMNRVEGEETRRLVMGPQSSEDLEAKALTASRPNPKSAIWGDQATRCDFCKKEGYREEDCWCLYLNLQPKGPKRGGFKDGDRATREERRGYAAQVGPGSEEVTQRNLANKAIELSLDQMRQMMQQLSVMLQTNIQQKTGITSNQVNTSLNIN